jgi:hypothetical protein
MYCGVVLVGVTVFSTQKYHYCLSTTVVIIIFTEGACQPTLQLTM